MVDENKRIEIDQFKERAVSAAPLIREQNAAADVSGERMTAVFPDRSVSIIYYRSGIQNAPLIIGFHGGGYLYGGNALDDDMWCAVRDALGADVASVEYRKSPEHMYRAALDDAYDVSVYLKERAGELGFDRDKIYVMGESAGAGLAASVCIYAKRMGNPIYKRQILVYPFLDCDTDPDTKDESIPGGPMMYVFNELHCLPGESADPLVSPVFADIDELRGLPDATVIYAENDSLRHEGMKYSSMLREAGVQVDDMLSRGMPHGFFESGFGDPEKNIQPFMGDDFNRMILDGTIHRASVEALDFIKKSVSGR